jgi:hypothetical protein
MHRIHTPLVQAPASFCISYSCSSLRSEDILRHKLVGTLSISTKYLLENISESGVVILGICAGGDARGLDRVQIESISILETCLAVFSLAIASPLIGAYDSN